MSDPRSTPEPTQTAPAAVPHPGDSTVLELRGTDVLAVLHRISTQKLDDLSVGAARVTLFCDFRGRLLHRAAVACGPDGEVWLLREDAPAATLAAFVDRHVFREEVRILDRSAEFTVLARPHAPDQAGGFQALDGGVRTVAPGDGVVLMIASRSGGMTVDSLDEERFRIGIGRARHGHEIVEAFNPFEVGLGSAVHLDKGCFTGQEALMRLVTYQSVRRRLVKLAGAGAPPIVPAPLTAAGSEVGTLTSAVADAGPGSWVGLAVVKNDFATGGHELEVEGRPLASVEAPPVTRARGRP